METDFPEIEEPCEADAWQEIVHCEHKLNHDDLDRLMAEFLANGGAVQEIGFGQRTDLVPVFNGQFIHKSSPLERMHEVARRRSAESRIELGDAELVKRMDSEIETSPTCSACHGSEMVFTDKLDHNGNHIEVDCPDCAQPSRAPELERPEVVASFRAILGGVNGLVWEYMDRFTAEPKKHGEIVQLIRLSDFDRIVGALRARNEWLEQVAVEAAETERHAKGLADGMRYKAELYDEVWALVTGKGYMNVTTAISVLEQQRDAAHARVAELENADGKFQWLIGLIDEECRYWHKYGDENRRAVLANILSAAKAAPNKSPVAQAGQVPEVRHWSDCATNNRGCPDLLGPCDCGGYKEGDA